MTEEPTTSSAVIDWRTLFGNAANAYNQTDRTELWTEAYAKHIIAAQPDLVGQRLPGLIEERLAYILMDARREQLLIEGREPIGDVKAWYAQYLLEHQEQLTRP